MMKIIPSLPMKENVGILPTRGRTNTGSDSGSNSSDELSRKVLNSIRSDRMEQHRHLVQSLDLLATNSSSQNLNTTPSHQLTPRGRMSPEPMIVAKKKCSDQEKCSDKEKCPDKEKCSDKKKCSDIDSSSIKVEKYQESFQSLPLSHIPDRILLHKES